MKLAHARLGHGLLVSLVMLLALGHLFLGPRLDLTFLFAHAGGGALDPMTHSRYVMAPLIASGVLVVACALALLMADFARRPLRFDGGRTWLLSAPIVGAGAWLIVTTAVPSLPPSVAAMCVVSSLAGLGVALGFIALVARAPRDIAWLLLAGACLAPCAMALRIAELPLDGYVLSDLAWVIAIGGPALGCAALVGVVALRARLGREPLSVGGIVVSALCVSYALLPLAHFVLLTPASAHYVTASANFFARAPAVQAWCIAAMCVGAWFAVEVQRRVPARPAPRALAPSLNRRWAATFGVVAVCLAVAGGAVAATTSDPDEPGIALDLYPDHAHHLTNFLFAPLLSR